MEPPLVEMKSSRARLVPVGLDDRKGFASTVDVDLPHSIAALDRPATMPGHCAAALASVRRRYFEFTTCEEVFAMVPLLLAFTICAGLSAVKLESPQLQRPLPVFGSDSFVLALWGGVGLLHSMAYLAPLMHASHVATSLLSKRGLEGVNVARSGRWSSYSATDLRRALRAGRVNLLHWVHIVALIGFVFGFMLPPGVSANVVLITLFLYTSTLFVYRFHAQSILRRERDATEQYVQSTLHRAFVAVLALQLLVFYKVTLIVLSAPFLPPWHYWGAGIFHACATEVNTTYIERFCDTSSFQLASARSPRQYGQPALVCADDLRPPFRSLFDACYAWRVADEVFLRATAGGAASYLAISALAAFGLLEGVAEGISLHNWWRHPVRGVALTSRAHAVPPSAP